MRAQLIPADGSSPLEIRRDLTLVGRKEDSDLCLPHKSISKMHCVIVKTDGLLLIRDLGSTNGTRVNGLRIRRAALLPNDQLSIAGFKFRVHFGPSPAIAPPADNNLTQRLDVEELSQLAQKQDGRGKLLGAGPVPSAFEPNRLPDVYSDRKDPRM
jgi:pSer/pThr/pTyr-binding forkhead associated (FHA) protein